MKLVISQVLLLILILTVLNILYEIFLIVVDNDPTKVLSKVMNELVYVAFLFFVMTNWLGGMNILENIIEPLMFEKIPKYIFSFTFGNKPLFSGNGLLLNVDNVWNMLEQIPNKIYDLKSAWIIFFERVIKSNLGIIIVNILMLFKPLRIYRSTY